MSDLAKQLTEGIRQLGLDLSAEQQQKLLDYQTLIQKWNKVYNLTAITDPQEMLTHHILDSLSVIAPLQRHLEKVELKQARLLDVGSGAGLPGVVIAICMPQVGVTCVDAVGKKAAFIQQCASALDLKTLSGLHSRVEEVTVEQPFDVITSRAFASLAEFVHYTKPLMAAGVWMAMKAKVENKELNSVSDGAGVFHVEPLNVPDLDECRCIVWMKKPSGGLFDLEIESWQRNRNLPESGSWGQENQALKAIVGVGEVVGSALAVVEGLSALAALS